MTQEGGYRLTGGSPVRKAGLPVVSVITVVYNGSGLIEKTLQSVLSQNWPNIEYIVIDGGSVDGTLEAIRTSQDRIAYWSSGPDRGIYDAMNKGLAAATGDYVWFMNAGDLIYDTDTLSKVFQSSARGIPENSRNYAAIYYGDTMIVDSGYREVGLRRLRPPENLSWRSFRKGMLVCHQAILVSRAIAPSFDPRYRHSADFDWTVRALKRASQTKPDAAPQQIEPGEIQDNQKTLAANEIQNKSVLKESGIVNTRLILCRFLDGGHSKQNITVSLRERFDSMRRHYGLLPTLVEHVAIVVRFLFYFGRHRRF